MADPVSNLTTKTLIQELDRGSVECIADSNPRGCAREKEVQRELWRRGYCAKDAQGHIAPCTPAEIAGDKAFEAAMDADQGGSPR